MNIDIQLNAARRAWPELLDLALAAEEAGYSAVWTFDHLAGSSLGGDTMLETFTLLGALAVATSTIELGTMVVNVHNRTPATLAVAAMSITAIADRPLHLGLGAGSRPGTRWSAEMDAIGQPIPATAAERHARLVEVLDVLDRLADPARPPELATFPRPRHPMPVVLGVNGPALAALAGRRTEGINVGWDHPRRDELFAVAVAAHGGRDGLELSTWATWSTDLLDPDHPTRRQMAGLDRLILVVPAGVTPGDVSGRRPR